MACKTCRIQSKHQKGQSLISASKITPENWHLTDKEISQALKSLSITVRTVNEDTLPKASGMYLLVG